MNIQNEIITQCQNCVFVDMKSQDPDDWLCDVYGEPDVECERRLIPQDEDD